MTITRHPKTLSFSAVIFAFSALIASAQEIGPKVSNESRLGVVVSSGNSRVQNYSLGHSTAIEWASDALKFSARALKSTASGVTSAENYELGLRYERVLNTRFNIFLGQSLRSDAFAGFDKKHNTDLGGKYYFVKETQTAAADKNLNAFAELGYRFTKTQFDLAASTSSHSLRAYLEAEKFWNASFSSKVSAEFTPSLSESSDWQLNSEISVAAAINSIFSLQSGVLIQFDHLPATGKEKTDTVFTTGLNAKF